MVDVQTIELAYNRVYVLESRGVRILVDAGPDYAGSWEALERAMTGRLPDVVICTHGHNDHAGLGGRWQARGAPVALDEPDHALVTRPQLGDGAEMATYEAYVRGCGAPESIQTEVLAGLAQRRRWAEQAATGEGYPSATRGTRWPTGIRMAPFQPDGLAAVHGVLEAAGVEVLQCPGHTPGNVVVASGEGGMLFSGDQLLPDITPTPGIQMAPPDGSGARTRFHSLPAFVASLEMLRERAWERCYPGHGDAFEDVAGRITENLSGIEERRERVLATLREMGEARVYDIAEQLYPRALARRFWQIVATVQGSLDLLAARDEAAENDGVYFPR